MKILFVCRANVGRSQMAAAFYNKFTGTHDADSAGTKVDVPGETLLERFNRNEQTYTLGIMEHDGIDISNSKRTQLTQDMLDHYDTIINMSELENTPDWLSTNPKYIYWEVTDPGARSREATIIAKDIIKEKVKEFISESK
ncbi:MAG: Protein-tyrosine-phosphatase [Candidatus Saccharibacteria bacterium]|nr:Protein-tyrosine-phosphatase [Candidatus Saccharibacteria bacterium]